MSTPIVDIVPMMREFNVSNDLLGDHAALQKRWDEDGYLFFRDVLDHEPLERIRGLLVDHLERHGFVERNDRNVRWTGK